MRATRPGGALTIGPTRVKPAPPDDPVEAAWCALRDVYDPELCIDVVALGLVYGIRDEDGTIVVDMTLTTPGCPVSETLPAMARAAIADSVSTSTGVDVRVVWDPPWNPAMMEAGASESLGAPSR